MLVEFGGWVLSRGMTGPDLHLGRLAVLLGQKQTAGGQGRGRGTREGCHNNLDGQ